MNKLMLLLIVVVSLIILLPVLLLEGAACSPGDANCQVVAPYITPTAPLPTCQIDTTVPCHAPEPTAPPSEHWINPEPWPTYESPYPAPPESYPAPAPYPEPPASYPEPQQNQPEQQTLANSIWAWVLDLFTN